MAIAVAKKKAKQVLTVIVMMLAVSLVSALGRTSGKEWALNNYT